MEPNETAWEHVTDDNLWYIVQRYYPGTGLGESAYEEQQRRLNDGTE